MTLLVVTVAISGCAQNKASTLNQTVSVSPAAASSPEPPEKMTTPEITEPNKSPITGFNYEGLPKYANKYYRYSKEAYDAASAENNVVYMYFYANWCPICKGARPKILEAFNKMNFDDVVGFEVHYNDDQVTEEDREITRNYQIPYQHTTIITKNKEQTFKSLEELSTETLIKEIERARGQ